MMRVVLSACSTGTRWRYVLCAIFVLLLNCNTVFAVPVSAEIKGDSFRWTSAEPSFAGGVVTSVWATPSGLVPADAYIAGATTLPSMPISLVGQKGGNVRLTLHLLGAEYNSPSLTGGRTDYPGGTANTIVNGKLVQVEGVGVGDLKLSLLHASSPFTHARPVISLGDTATILQAFRDANAEPGNYVSNVSIPMTYHYELNGVRIAYNWSLPLSLEIKYSPAVLSDLTLTSPTGGAMTPNYYSSGGIQFAKGQAMYNGVATGVFPNGLRLFLKSGDNYTMAGPNGTTIPFSVVCAQCTQQLLVDKGNIVLSDLDTAGTVIPGINMMKINFDINIDFADVALSTLQTGAYQGRFSLLFEPNV
jgi:hypothetical protein